MRFVDEQDDRAGRALNLVDDLTQTTFELAFHAGAGRKQADVQRPQAHVLELRRHVARGDALREALDDGGFSDAGFAGQDGIVLPPSHQDLNELPNLFVAADDRIDFAATRSLGQVDGVASERFLFAELGRRRRAAAVAAGSSVRAACALARRVSDERSINERSSRSACRA